LPYLYNITQDATSVNLYFQENALASEGTLARATWRAEREGYAVLRLTPTLRAHPRRCWTTRGGHPL